MMPAHLVIMKVTNLSRQPATWGLASLHWRSTYHVLRLTPKHVVRDSSDWQPAVSAKLWNVPNRKLVVPPEMGLHRPCHHQSSSLKISSPSKCRTRTMKMVYQGQEEGDTQWDLVSRWSPSLLDLWNIYDESISFYLTVDLLSHTVFCFKQTYKAEQAWIIPKRKNGPPTLGLRSQMNSPPMSPYYQTRISSFTILQ